MLLYLETPIRKILFLIINKNKENNEIQQRMSWIRDFGCSFKTINDI
jgi:hypothetical protein